MRLSFSTATLALTIVVPSLLGTACTTSPLTSGAAANIGAALTSGAAATPGAVLTPGAAATTANAPVANQPGDAAMTCEQIKAEINQMNEILGVAQGEIRAAESIGLTKDLAINGALQSGALASAGSSVPYLGAAMNMMNQANTQKKAAAEARVTAAYNRRSVLTGMYAVKGCGN